jgi:hypothetical protein
MIPFAISAGISDHEKEQLVLVFSKMVRFWGTASGAEMFNYDDKLT